MGVPLLFTTWVESELPWLYDKKADYQDPAQCYALLTKVKKYYEDKADTNANAVYNSVWAIIEIKKAQLILFQTMYGQMSAESEIEEFDLIAKNGLLSELLNTYKLLEEKLSDLILPMGG